MSAGSTELLLIFFYFNEKKIEFSRKFFYIWIISDAALLATVTTFFEIEF